MKKENGFTLVEILVVLAVLSVVGVLILTIFSRSLRGSNKSQIISSIKQNGQSVLENIDKTIRNADDLVCIDNGNINPDSSFSPNNSTVVITKGGIYTRYRITLPSDETGPKECKLNNGCIIQDNPLKQIDPDTNKEETDLVFIRRICNAGDPLDNRAQVMTDTNLQAGVSVLDGRFESSELAGFKEAIRINFVLSAGVGAPQVIAGQIDPVKFETTIQLR